MSAAQIVSPRGGGGGAKHIATYAPAPGTERGVPVHLGVDAKKGRIVYVSARNVVIRSVANPLDCEVYTEHSCDTTVAKMSPSGFYVASGDQQGRVRIWDCANPEQTHILKAEYPVLGAAVKDLAWSEDSKRIVAVGDGREVFGRAFLFDSGSSVGEISGHAKTLNTCDFKPSRPYRVATGGLDNTIGFFQGPPFKFHHSCKDHQRFVNCIRFSPDGARFVSVGSDKNAFFFDGKSGERIADMALDAGSAHKAGIYSASWADNDTLLTASADKTARLWSVADGACKAVFEFADKPQTEHQQLGCLAVAGELLSVSLGGDVTYLDTANPKVPKRVLHGHNKFITAIAYDADADALVTGDYTGKLVHWDVKTGATAAFDGKGHTNQVRRLVAKGGMLVSTAMDDTVRVTSLSAAGAGGGRAYSDAGCAATKGQPTDLGVAAAADRVAVCTNQAVQLIGGIAEGAARVLSTLAIDYEATAVAVSPDGKHVAVGGGERDNKVRVYAVGSDGALGATPVHTIEKHRGAITAIAYSPDGALMATTCRKNDIFVWSAADAALKVEGWCFHSAPALRLAWAPDSNRLASGGLDSSIFVWNVASPETRIQISRAHPLGVTDVTWLNNDTLASTGNDVCTRTWSITS